jgi:signal transduction histidine kinase
VGDVGAVIILAVTPFVFLIVYGFHTHGLGGATLWAAATVGLHFVLNRLHARRLTVEEQNRRLETLNRELAQRERLSAIGKMSSVISHQILHELGVIGIYADLIRNAERDDEIADTLARARQHGLAIEGALRNVNRVLTDLLVFSKDLRLNLYDHSLRRILEECVDECRAEAEERGLALRADSLDDVTVRVDKLKLKQAVSNVLRNAIEVSPAGTAVRVETRVGDATVEVRVADEGPGVPERDRETVFTPFFTTKEHGTGLGLAIAREFTEAHRGRLTVEPSPGGQGATFVFRLPLGFAESVGPTP